jgi:hypothetical protein
MPNAVLRSLTGMVPFGFRRRRSTSNPRRVAAPVAAGEALEERRLLALTVAPVPAGTAAATLATTLVVPGSGITVTGGTYVGANNQGGTYAGLDTTSQFGQRLQIPDGVILTTGRAADALGPNDAPDTGVVLGTAGDTNLNTDLSLQTVDANALTLNFTAPLSIQSVLFDFVFGTEQYTEFGGAFRNDAFAAYLDGARITSDAAGRPPSMDDVSYDNIQGEFDIEYDGLIPRFRVRAPLNTALLSHTLKFVIADGDLGTYDSGVFLSRLQGSTVPTPAATVETPTPGQLQFATPTYTVNEAAGVATVTVSRTNGSSGQVTVDYATAPDTAAGAATAGVDYTPVTGTITFFDGQATQTLTVPILQDTLYEGDETLLLSLSNPTDATLGTPTQSTLVIQDDEPAIQFAPSTYTVNETAGSVTLTVARSGSATGTVTVDYATANGADPATSAQAPADYLSRSGTLTFGEGQTTATITVPIIPDFVDGEPNETFTVTLANPVGGTPAVALGGQPVATVTIVDVTRPPTIYDVTAFAPKNRIEAIYLQVNQELRPETVLDPANYDLFVHRETRLNTQSSRQRVAIRQVEWNPTLKTITVRPMSPLKNNVFYEIVARGTTPNGLIGVNNQPLDGNFDRFVNPALGGGDDFIAYFGRGNRLRYFDANGDNVLLGSTGGGVIEVFRDLTRDARQVRYINPVPATSAIFGKVTPAKRGGDRVTPIGSLLLNGARSFLATPPFQVTYQI